MAPPGRQAGYRRARLSPSMQDPESVWARQPLWACNWMHRCNQLHNVPLVFPITQQSDNFTPNPALAGFNFPAPVLGKTTVSFATFDPHAPPQYVQQWSASLQKSLGPSTVLEAGYTGAHGLHLQLADLINNADR